MSVKRRLFEVLQQNKIGTTSIGIRAWKLNKEPKQEDQESKGVSRKEKRGKWERVLAERDPEKDCDILNLKIKYCVETKGKIRQEYQRINRDIKKEGNRT